MAFVIFVVNEIKVVVPGYPHGSLKILISIRILSAPFGSAHFPANSDFTNPL